MMETERSAGYASALLPSGEQDGPAEHRQTVCGLGSVLRSRLRRGMRVNSKMTAPAPKLQQAQQDLLKQVRNRGSSVFGKLPAAEAPLMKRARRHTPAPARHS